MGDISINLDVATDIAVGLDEAIDIAINVPSDILGGDVIANGNFDSDTVWSKGASWTITGGKAVGTATTSNLRQNGILTVGTTFRVLFTVSDYVAGSFFTTCGTTVGALVSANGAYEQFILCAGNTNFLFNGVVAFTGKIDNVRAYPV